MKSKLLFVISLFLAFALTNCEEQTSPINESDEEIVETEDCTVKIGLGKISQKWRASSLDSASAKWIEEEYEYDMDGKITRISRPGYDNNERIGIYNYDDYFYNDKGLLIRISNYNYNSHYEIFEHLLNTEFEYSQDGHMVQEIFELVRVGTSELTLYYYESDTLIWKEKFDDESNLMLITTYEYDTCGRLSKESEYYSDSTLVSYKVNFYMKGHLIKTDEFGLRDMWHIAQYLMTYNEENDLEILEIISMPEIGSNHKTFYLYNYLEE